MPLHEVISPDSALIGRETIDIKGKKVKVFTYLENRNYCRAAIGSKGVHIRLARWMSKDQQKEQYDSLKKWAVQHLQTHGAMVLYKGFRTYNHGADFEIAGRTFHIQKNYKEGASSKGKLKNNIMQLYLASGMTEREEQEHSSYLVSKLIGTAFLPDIRKRLEAINIQHFQKPIGRVRLRNNVSNWGSCSHDGNISISTRLLFAPYETVEYVLIHELAHLVEHNHSDRFWKQVARVMPNYKQHEKWLDKNGDKCQF